MSNLWAEGGEGGQAVEPGCAELNMDKSKTFFAFFSVPEAQIL